MKDAPTMSSTRPKTRTTITEYGRGRNGSWDSISAIPPTRTTIPTTSAAMAPMLVDRWLTTVSVRCDAGAATTVAGTCLVVTTVAVPATGSAGLLCT
jgi:hypothetical protein